MSILSELKVVVINCQSVCSKKSCYNNLVDYYDPHIVFGTESWLRPEISNSEILFPVTKFFVKIKQMDMGECF